MIKSSEGVAINELANDCLLVLENLKTLDSEVVQISKEKLVQITSGYLRLYSLNIESNLIPKFKNNNNFNYYIH